ncbi:sulfide:quinone oxidoreductase [Aliiroseovarius halocynthiae]|uniref:TIGR01244 family phosphatase n=1 Tax=Aliiroseovarius halocynthiae TaxID=985055 RepID=A0A545SVQ6_9RHOB|nr:TIGR01244 family sulfur transferase [Aliiroseovarius halocynthiae]TQV69052.1 TIGR01244 family phosphatase [Aliiroseovarius halocynthiae]SMR71804.1 sulfide:quinone oxidoreductase [Aliiroseovarius halocynthiae]
MQTKKLDDTITVSHQIAIEDVQTIRDQGFTLLMCNRPDGEDPGQPAWGEVKAAAEAAGLKTAFLPVSSRDEAIAMKEPFQVEMASADGPVFAYCRTGTRCEILWTLSKN